MAELKVLKGGLSKDVNIFSDMKFINCMATDTRLMGVVALKLLWNYKSNDFIQLFHLDFSEYGVDGYYDTDTTDNIESKWIHMSGGLGGNEVSITFPEVLGLINHSQRINLKHRKNHSDDLIDFQMFIESIYKHMLEASDGIVDDGTIFMDSTCKKISNHFESINYFIMRIYDDDFCAANHISIFNRDRLSEIILLCNQSGSLIRNKIIETSDNKYSCKALLLTDNGYYYLDVSITIDPANKKIKEYYVNHEQKVSEIEAAFYTRQREYITMFKINSSLEDFDLEKSKFVDSLDYKNKDTGFLHIIYNKNNNHVCNRNYFMSGDMYGAYFVTKSNQLLLMSHKIINITRMEDDLLSSTLMDNLELVDRYQFEHQILESFMNHYDSDFENFIYEPNE
ncbi:MAG: hypothetical protein JJE03_07580 [Peptostreptococcaceae bacterium]|nr:hypothetical protein [Peptostreptococcaceae bacterium]